MSARSPRPLAVVVILDLAAVVDWVSEPATLEERRRRGEAAKRALAAALELHHDDVNRQIRTEAHLAASWTSRPPSPSITRRN